MGIAAQVAARRLRRHGQVLWPDPSRGTGDLQPDGTPVEVQLLIDGIWTTESSLVYARQQISMSSGTPDEGSALQPASCKFLLNNRDGRFSPRNPTSPLYGKIGRNTQVRVTVPTGNVSNVRFWGEISSWPVNWDPTGNDVWVEVEAAGIMRRLAQGSLPLESPLYREVVRASQTDIFQFAFSLRAYWPMEEQTNATQIASAVTGAPPMSITGTPAFASYSGFVCSAAIPNVSGCTLTANMPAFQVANNNNQEIDFLLAAPNGITNGTVIARVFTAGTPPRFDIVYPGTNELDLIAYNADGTVNSDQGAVSVPIVGTLNYVKLSILHDNTLTSADLSTQVTTALTQGATAGTFSTGTTAGQITQIVLNPGAVVSDMYIGHLAVFGHDMPASGGLNGSDAPLTFRSLNAYQGEAADVRFQRLCTEQLVPVEVVPALTANGDGTFSGTGVAMGYQTQSSLTTLLQECVDADQGLQFESWDQFGAGYMALDGLLNQTAVLALDYSQAQLVQIPKPIDDDRYTRNDITVTRTGGSVERVQQLTGALSVNPPPSGVGSYPDSPSLNLAADSQLADAAGWLLHTGTVDEGRFPVISVHLQRQQFVADPQLREAALNVRIGSRITVANPPAWVGADQLSLLVIGMSETLTQFEHILTFVTRPESPYRVAVADDTVLGRADTDGSTLAAPAGAADTTISVATTNSSSPTWTTHLSDYPFDLSIGGERMTATGPGTVLNADPTMVNGLASYTEYRSSGGPDGTYQYVSGQNPILCIPDGTDTAGGLNGHQTASGSVTPAATYTVGCWVYCPQGWTDVRACIDWYDNTNTYLSTSLGSTSTISTGVWTFLAQDLTAVASATSCQPRFRWGSSPAPTVQFWVYTLAVVPDSTVSASSPQTLSVLRSVNGVSKPQAQGTNVQLWQPATLMM